MNTEEIERAKTLKASGLSIHQIALTLKRDDKTIKKCLATPEAIEQVKEIKKDLISKFENLADKLIDSIKPADIEKSSMLQRVTASGIAIDKSRLLSNQSTSNEAVIILQVPDTKEEYLRMKEARKKMLEGENDD